MLFILDGISERVAHVWRKRVLFDEYLWILLTAVEHLIQIEIPILLYFILFSHIFTIFSLFNKFRLRGGVTGWPPLVLLNTPEKEEVFKKNRLHYRSCTCRASPCPPWLVCGGAVYLPPAYFEPQEFIFFQQFHSYTFSSKYQIICNFDINYVNQLQNNESVLNYSLPSETIYCR